MRAASSRLRRLTLVAVAVSGAAAIIQQIAWTRIVALAMGPTTFAFSAVVAIFIGGLALGAFAGAWLAGRTTSVAPLVAALCGAGVLALIVLGGVPWAVIRVAEAVAAPGATFATLVRSHALLLAMTLLPLTLAFGAVFPLALGVAAVRHSSIGANVAAVFVANTAGALAGAMAAGFWLVPALGLQGTVRASAIAMLAAGALIALGAERRVRLAAEVAALAVAALIVWRLAAWDPALISSGGYKYAAYVPPELRGPMLRAGTLLYYREGAASTVSVRRTAGVTTLSIDGKVDASNAGRHAHAAAAGACPVAAARTTAPRWHHRPRQRRHAGERAPPPDRTRRRRRDLARGRRRLVGTSRGRIEARCRIRARGWCWVTAGRTSRSAANPTMS